MKYLKIFFAISIILILASLCMRSVSKTPSEHAQLPDNYSYKYGVRCRITGPGKGECNDHDNIYIFCNYQAYEPCRPTE